MVREVINMENTAILIPCFNEEVTIEKVISDFKNRSGDFVEPCNSLPEFFRIKNHSPEFKKFKSPFVVTHSLLDEKNRPFGIDFNEDSY